MRRSHLLIRLDAPCPPAASYSRYESCRTSSTSSCGNWGHRTRPCAAAEAESICQFLDANYSLSTKGHSIAAGTLRPPSSQRSSASAGSTPSREAARRANTSDFGIMNADRSRTRRERTFVGSECAVCEEPLEHTLQGERILQFSCSHVSHEACFYEFIREFESQYCPTCNAPLHLDTSRGGNVLDIGRSGDSFCTNHH